MIGLNDEDDSMITESYTTENNITKKIFLNISGAFSTDDPQVHHAQTTNSNRPKQLENKL